jgi:23S rRNA (uracil747-C5)-methyltransferase
MIGIEIEPQAIACAKMSAQSLGLTKISFQALDSQAFAQNSSTDKPDLIIVNPPRRGLGQELCMLLSEYSPKYILYSSCNPITLAKDLTIINGYQIEKIQLFDMFPHTNHYEVLVLLKYQIE